MIIKTRATKTGVKGKLATCTFMMPHTKSPQPLMRFSEKSLGMTCLMLPTMTLLTIPVIDFVQSIPREMLVLGTTVTINSKATEIQ